MLYSGLDPVEYEDLESCNSDFVQIENEATIVAESDENEVNVTDTDDSQIRLEKTVNKMINESNHATQEKNQKKDLFTPVKSVLVDSNKGSAKRKSS